MTVLSQPLSLRKLFRRTLLIVIFVLLCVVVERVHSAATRTINASPHLPSALTPPSAPAPVAAAVQAVTDLLVLHFDGTLNGEQGETPTQSANILFQPGVIGQGVLADRNSRLTYPSDGNINATEGTIELWIKPSWNGADLQSRVLLKYGSSGALWLSKEGTNLRFALNRDSENGSLVMDVLTDVSSWVAGQWHHVAATWSNAGQFIRLYVDGTLMSERSLASTTTLPTIDNVVNSTLQLGGDGVRQPLVAILDEVYLSSAARSSQDIATRMLRGITVTTAALTPTLASIPISTASPITMYPGWNYWQDFRYAADTNIGALSLPFLAATFSNFDANIARIDDVTGRIRAVAVGTTTVRATLNGVVSDFPIRVLSPGAVTMETLSPPAGTSVLDAIPVAIIRYFPTTDGTTLNAAAGITPAPTLAALRTTLGSVERKLEFMLEEGSKFRGYKNASAQQSLNYRIVKIITVNEEVPPGLPSATSGVYFPDYKQIFKRADVNVRDLVVTQGVKEIWLEQYVNGRITLNESNMSSPLTGDISSSLRTNDDMPVYPKAYTVFGLNYAQSENNAVRHHGHHLEALLTYANVKQDGDDLLFQESFIGRDLNGNFQKGRCGKTDRPPNSDAALQFNNTTAFSSDIEDWYPDNSGVLKDVSSATWGQLNYLSPEPLTEPIEGRWYIYWLQAIPGDGNNITRLGSERMTNWWAFVADWDKAIRDKLGLVRAIVCQYTLSSTSLGVANTGGTSSVGVTAGLGCTWDAVSNVSWITINPGFSGVANGTVNFTVAANTGAARTGTMTIAGQTVTVTQDNNNPAPTLTSLEPATVLAGSAGFTLTLNGTGFVTTSSAQVNGTSRTTTFVNSTKLTIEITAADIATTGTRSITVFNSLPGGGTSNAQTLNINNPAPTLTSLSQTSALAGSPLFTLTVNGTNFVSTSKVHWNGTERATTFVSATQLTAVIPATDLANAGTANVTVFTPTPGGGTTSALTFTITPLCNYVLNPTSQNFAAAGGNGSTSITAGTGCTWTAVSNVNWITTTSSGSGNGTVNFTVAANAGAARTGTLTVQGQTYTVIQDAATATCVAQRTLPAEYLAGLAFEVSIQATPAAATQSYAVEETPPAGWTVAGIDNNGQFDAANGKVKWGPFFDATARTLKYSVTPPAGTTGQKAFTGTVSVNGTSSTICGTTSIAAASQIHPADLGNNLRIEINELTAYGAAWKSGTTWSRPPNPIDINYLTNAGLIWKLGEVYRFDATKTPPFVAGASISQRPATNPSSAELSSELALNAQGLQLLRAVGFMPGLGLGFAAALDEALATPSASLVGGAVVSSFSAANYVPGVGVTVTIAVTPDAGTQVYAVEDTVPLGWAVTNVNNSGAFDSTNRKVKWGPFFDNAARSLTYVVTPPTGETGAKTFVGSASFDGVSVSVTGTRALSSVPLCTYGLSAASQSFSALSGTGSFNITALTGCTWNATTTANWVTITQGSGNGNGTVQFSVTANGGAARTGTISIAGQSFTVNQAANAAPTITPASALIRQQGATAAATTIATVSDAETAVGNLFVATTSLPTGLSITDITNTNGTISAVVTASCLATPGANVIGLRVTDAQGSSTQANLTVNVLSNPNCFLQIADTSGSDQRIGSVLLYNYYSSTLGNAAFENTQIRLTNTHDTQDTAVRLYFVDAQTAAVFSLFVCLAPTQTFNFLMSETDPGVTGHIIAVAVSKTTGCPTNFNFLAGSAAVKLSAGHVATLGAVALAALTAPPTTCASGQTAARLNFDGISYGRLPRLLVVDNLGSLRDGNTTRLIVTRVGGSLTGTAGGLGTITGKIYNSNRAMQDFTFSATAPQFIGNLSASFPRLTTRLDSFIPAGQSGWMKLWTDANWGMIGSVMNLPANLRTPSGFVGGFNLPQGALANAVSLEVPISVPTCQ